MATTLYLQSTAASTHRASNSAKLNGSASGWNPRALATTRGSGVTASGATATVTGATAGIEVTDGTFPYEWLSEPVAADVTISGTITANIWAAENSMTANVAINVVIDILRNDAADTIVQIVKSTRVTEEALTTRAAANFTTGMTSGYSSQTLQRGDRLRVRVFGDDAGVMATGFTFNASFAGTTAAADGDSYVTFTENITFESAPGSPTVLANNLPGLLNDGNVGTTSFAQRQAQSLSLSSGGSTTGVDLWLRKVGTPTDNVVVDLQSDSGGAPSGTVLATASVAGTSLTTSETRTTLTFSYTLAASTTYWVVVTRSGASSDTNFYNISYNNSGGYAGGARSDYSSGAWTARPADDLYFVLNGPASATTTLYLTNAQSGLSGAPALLSSFTGADENPLSEGGNWANVNSAGTALQRISNAVASTAGSTGNFYWTPANFGPDLEIYATISTVSTTFGVAARIQGEGGAGTWDGYRADVTSTSTTLRRVDNSAVNTLVSASTTWSNGDKVGLRCEGSTIQVWRQASGSSDWNLVCTAVDATYPGAGKIGVCAGTTVGRLDDLYAATDSNLFTQKAWTSRGSGVVSYLSDTDAGFVSPLLTAEWFTPQLSAVTLTGMAQANIRALESNASANASLRCEIARVSSTGSSPTVWASWCMSANNTRTGELNTSESAETIYISGDDLAISDGQRLRIRLYNDDMPTTAMGNAFTVQRFYNGTSAAASGDSYITFPVALSEFSAGGTTYTKAGYGKESG